MYFLCKPLNTRTDRREGVRLGALRTRLRHRHAEAAMMTDQPPLEPMVDQPRIAIWACEAIAAGTT